MLIHDFHSKLMSGKEEGMLFEALRKVKGFGGPALATDEVSNWSVWAGETGTSTEELGWSMWQEDGTERFV